MGTSPVDPYENPLYRGPECDGLSDDSAFDLAKQLRIAARNKRLAQKLGDDRVRRDTMFPLWTAILALALLVASLTAAIEMVRIVRL